MTSDPNQNSTNDTTTTTTTNNNNNNNNNEHCGGTSIQNGPSKNDQQNGSEEIPPSDTVVTNNNNNNDSTTTTSTTNDNKTSDPAVIAVKVKSHHNNNNNNNYESTKSKLTTHLNFICHPIFLRIIILDIPFIVIFFLYLSIHHLHWLSYNYLVPLNTLQYFDSSTSHDEQGERDLTYYHRICTQNDQTTYDTTDLIVDIHCSTTDNNSSSSNSSNDNTKIPITIKKKINIAVQQMLRHGVTIIPNLISVTTATKLRDYIIQQNQIQDHLIYVIENQFRWSFPIQVDQDPIIIEALQEILVSSTTTNPPNDNNNNNNNLISYLEAIMGPNPAVIEFTAITQAYGAKEQFWHQDVVPSGSAVKYGRKYIPSYSLFIPLQNVTAEMGATGICPGTHMCSESDFCTETGFQTSGTNNNWPLGYGALVNQQTTHRGSAHRDPNGPQRVVFILTFAPRPVTFQPYNVETRLIGTGGSYSLHWSQWGHTVQDYQYPLQRMQQPYRTLRSLGLYNPYGSSSNTDWGWDYISVSSARIANEDVGFTQGDFEDFVTKGGFQWLPKHLQGNITVATNDQEEDELPTYGWKEFLLETIHKCKLEITKVYYSFLGGYVGLTLLFVAVSGRGMRWKALLNNTFRLSMIHVVLLSGAWFARYKIIHSSWGRNIQGHRSFRLSNNTLALAPSLPATMPTDDDIFIFEAMQSETLSSFSRVLEVFHPGNREWDNLLDQMSSGYDHLSSTLQAHVRNHILRLIENESQRILIQTNQFHWATSTPEMQQWFCHKRLLQKSNPIVDHVVQNLDNAFSDTRYGYWRDTVLYQKHISRVVYNLRNDLMQMQEVAAAYRQKKGNDRLSPSNNQVSGKRALLTLWTVATIRINHTNHTTVKSTRRGQNFQSSFPSTTVTTQKTQDGITSTWLSVGDIAEASYFDDTTEWYRCTITNVYANRGVWDVIYDDGDMANDLCRTCVRPFIPYAINETIDIKIEPDQYVPCHVVAIHRVAKNDFVYDIIVDDGSNKLIINVSTKRLRRKYRDESEDDDDDDEGNNDDNNSSTILSSDTRVMALYRDDDGNAIDYFPGRIIQYSTQSKLYDIEFDDGDVAYHVPRRDIKKLFITK